MTTDMVDRLADTLRRVNSTATHGLNWDELLPHMQDWYRRQARAAIGFFEAGEYEHWDGTVKPFTIDRWVAPNG